jgi:hypothetical protein
MWKKAIVIGGAGAAVACIGTAALASSSTPAPSPSPTGSSVSATGSAPTQKHSGRAPWRRALHAQWVTRDGKNDGGFTTHDAIRGKVTSVSATSITVMALDHVSQTYTISATTKIHVRGDGKGKAGTIGEVKAGDRVGVLGTGTASLAALRIIDVSH